jgi:hypothetical protein
MHFARRLKAGIIPMVMIAAFSFSGIDGAAAEEPNTGPFRELSKVRDNRVPKVSELELRTDFKVSPLPLTVEQVWALDPSQTNPHLQRWVVSRRVDLVGLKATPIENAKYRAAASMIDSAVEAHVRGPGAWFQDLAQFSCKKKSDSAFETITGAQLAATNAGDLWAAQLKEQRYTLALLLSRVKAESPVVALHQGEMVFRQWLKMVESRWRVQVALKVRDEEWNFYLKEAADQDICPRKMAAAEMGPLWKLNADPIVGEPPTVPEILARAPARMWNGLYSVRLLVTVDGKALDGRFLIDSAVNQSIISPSWLESQGVYPALTLIPGLPPKRVELGGLTNAQGDSSLGRMAWVDRVELSGMKLPMNEFLLLETDFFSPPENLGTCCDGVLGNDFLRLYPIQMQSQAPPEVRVWPREKFHWSSDTPWLEVSESPSGKLVSGCSVVPADGAFSKAINHGLGLPGISWDTGSEDVLGIHTPWKQSAQGNIQNEWNIECNSFQFGKGILGTPSKSAVGMSERIPAVNIGTPLLARGSFTFDLPHGRIWFAKDSLTHALPKKNDSGLVVDYVMVRGDRKLYVKSMRPKTRAQPLITAGMKHGTEILLVDGKPAGDFDLWEINQMLAGNRAETVTLQWATRQGLREVAIRVR